MASWRRSLTIAPVDILTIMSSIMKNRLGPYKFEHRLYICIAYMVFF